MDYDKKIIKDNFISIKNNIKKSIANEQIYNDFIKNVLFYDVIDNKIILLVSSSFIKTTIENNYKELFTKSFESIISNKSDIVFLTQEEIDALEQKQKSKNKDNQVFLLNNSNTNSSLSFENFYVANFNKGAYNAVRSIFNSKKLWNPIFISGGVGLGKTHLLHAAGNEYAKIHSKSKIKYVTSDEIVREIYHALSSKNEKDIEELKDEYQSYDLLLIDDVQFLAKKEKINEIFFNIFNYNITNNKMIILTSDKHPNQLENFEPRMISRFTSGLHIQINKPSLEAMTYILEMKIKEECKNYVFTSDAIDYIVRRNKDDIRKLGGYLNKIMFYVFNDLPPNSVISISVIKKATDIDDQNEIKNKGYTVDPNIVIDLICSTYGVNSKQVKSKSRKHEISNARQVCQYVLREKYKMPYDDIGKYFSSRSHSTVIESVEKISKAVEKDENLKNFIEKIYKNI
ncbi:MAG: chromosomal replication initiator protein DnaA [Mycoplasma sp.]|nr:chromosomal replication initiator protein DnaA [Mycoplasma sp.]